MRLPASTAKLEEKLERYTSAVQVNMAIENVVVQTFLHLQNEVNKRNK